jgi:hypothetical protein
VVEVTGHTPGQFLAVVYMIYFGQFPTLTAKYSATER